MKPNFALSLSFEGIALLHRADAGWHLVGEVTLDSEDMVGDLAALRTKAKALDPSGFATKLILPNEQIKYLELSADSAPDGDLDRAVTDALDGATPYALDDLAYDWALDGDRILVAAVARETLEEADLQRLYDEALTDWIEAGYVTSDEAEALAEINLGCAIWRAIHWPARASLTRS